MVGEQVVRGVVKWFNDSHGYGFITPAEGGRDVFVHWTCLDKNGQRWTTLTPGQNVEFLIVDTPKGPKAVQVRPATEVNGNQ